MRNLPKIETVEQVRVVLEHGDHDLYLR
jgi:hypothetical protein